MSEEPGRCLGRLGGGVEDAAGASHHAFTRLGFTGFFIHVFDLKGLVEDDERGLFAFAHLADFLLPLAIRAPDIERKLAGQSGYPKPSINERLKDELNKPRERLEIEDKREQKWIRVSRSSGTSTVGRRVAANY